MKNFAKKIILITASIFFLGSGAVIAQTVTTKDLQKNTEPLNSSLSIITRLQPVSFEYSAGKYRQLNLPSGKQFGFTEDIKSVLPGAFTTRNVWYTAGKNNQQAVTVAEPDLQKLVPLLVGAVKEQQAEIERLRAEIDQLKRSR